MTQELTVKVGSLFPGDTIGELAILAFVVIIIALVSLRQVRGPPS